jgi:PPK2 family polyphosphate:nucleotide phosphotransferase
MKANDLVVPVGTRIKLAKQDTSSKRFFPDDGAAEAHTNAQVERLTKLQDIFQAHARYGVLIIFQGMDSAGKDETINAVLRYLDPQISQAKQFKSPSEVERKHDYLWRAVQALPARGQVGIFNRSYYEQVTSEQIYPDQIEQWGLPDEAREGLWERRYAQINNFERHLVENGFLVLKFLLHVSKDVARERLLERTEQPELHWQFSESDLQHYEDWDAYQEVFEAMLHETNTAWAPWHLIPADERAGAYAAVATVLVERLAELHKEYPPLSDDERKTLEKARKALKRAR